MSHFDVMAGGRVRAAAAFLALVLAGLVRPAPLVAQFGGEAPPSITIVAPASGSTRHALNPKIRLGYDTGTCLDDGSGSWDPVPGTLVVKINGGTNRGPGEVRAQPRVDDLGVVRPER